jgi:ubiquinone/menaquinone biosynthesis C-methylase UbiE
MVDVAATFAEDAFQGFLRGLKLHWREALYRSVLETASAKRLNDPRAIEAMMRDDVDYKLYAWLERQGQRFKYLSRYGMLGIVERQASQLTSALAVAEKARPHLLKLNTKITLPSYYVDSDFHQHPGGIWSDDIDAWMYEWAANAFSFSMASADKPYAWFAGYIADRFRPRRVVDWGCGFGKSTLPLKRVLRDAEVSGIDLSAPALRLAHLRACQAELEIAFVQAPAEASGIASGSCDAIVSTWLLHELPPRVIREVLREGLRVLAPGGIFASHDMHTAPGGPVGAFFHFGHAARNNEPFLPGLIALDIAAALREAGFVEVELLQSMTGAPARRDEPALSRERTHLMTVAIGRKPA